MVIEAIYAVLSIFLLVGAGMLLFRLKWIGREHMPLLSRLVVKVALPGMIVSKLFTQYTRSSLIESAPGIAAPLISLVLTGLCGLLVARLIKIPKGRVGVFCCMFMFSNSVFVGLPVSMALFGDGVVPYTLLYYIANTVLFWSAGYQLLSRDGGAARGKLDWRKLVPLPLVVFFSCAALVLMGLKMPPFVISAAEYLGGMVTPLSLIYTGIVIMDMLGRGRFRWERGYTAMLCGRFLVAPVMLILTGLFIPMPTLMRNALLIQAAMPVMGQTPIVCGECGSDAEYAAGGIALSTALSLLFIPLYMAVIPLLP